MSEIPSPGRCRGSVELQIDRVVVASLEQATVHVRCLRGPVRRGALRQAAVTRPYDNSC
ncbi:hypothetical protein [Streptomyces sp. NPDC048277]|uniref:hypothetical protein n=1 Tax=Streptomyces sp. NPDC048277 TaxID=3155027 RepID=UPI0033FE73E9